MAEKPFAKITSTGQLELVRIAHPATGSSVPCPVGRYPEVFVRLRVHIDSPDDVFTDSLRMARAPSPLRRDPDEVEQAQVLFDAVLPNGLRWTLALTEWGALQWVLRAEQSGEPILEARSPFSIGSLVDTRGPFYTGVAIMNPVAAPRFSLPHEVQVERSRVRIVAGSSPGTGLSVEGEARGFDLKALMPLPETFTVGTDFRGSRATAAHVEEVLIANSELFHLFDDTRTAAAMVKADFPGGSALAPFLVDDTTIGVYPGVEFETTSFNYWHFFKVQDPSIRTVRIERLTQMCNSFFTSIDRQTWQRAALHVIGRGPEGERRGEVALPPHEGDIYVANAPVYGEQERDRDLERARQLGASVEVVATSTGGLPVHLVSLTAPGPIKDRIGIVLTCGQHSPLEQMTGWLGMPCIEELCRLDREEPTRGLLSRFVFYWVPIFNVDSARCGGPGNSLCWTNPNRQWFDSIEPEQRGVEQFFVAAAEHGVKIGLMIDAHGGGVWRNHTILASFMATADEVAAGRVQGADVAKLEVLRILEQVAGLQSVWPSVATPVLRTGPHWFQDTFGCPAFILETSIVSYFDPCEGRTRVFTHQSITDLGRNLARAFCTAAGLLAAHCST